MKNILFVIGLSLVLIACSKAIEKPKNLLSQDKMVEVLTEVFMYQQTAYLTEINNPDLDFSTVDALILKKHEVSPDEFKASYNYYVMVPDKYKEILTEIRDNLEAQLPEVDRKQRENDRKNGVKNNF